MKKKLAIMIALLLLPAGAFAMTAITDGDMAGVTGQAGVSINMDVNLNLHMDTAAWGDSDGLNDGTTTGGWIGMTNFDASGIHIRPRDDYAGDSTQWGNLQLLTIDVATDPTNTLYNGATFVRIGLGTMEISMSSLNFDVSLGSDETTLASTGQNLGSVALTNFDTKIAKDSYFDIYAPTSGSGVNMNFNVALDTVSFDALSWGDSDGLGATNTAAGYVGFKNASISNLTFTGPLSIDVATAEMFTGTDGSGNPAPAATDYLPGGIYAAIGAGPAFVHIGLGSGNSADTSSQLQFGMGSFSADCVVASDSALATNAGTLGSMYISGLTVSANGFVDIMAH